MQRFDPIRWIRATLKAQLLLTLGYSTLRQCRRNCHFRDCAGLMVTMARLPDIVPIANSRR
jgi:hypothetical protein